MFQPNKFSTERKSVWESIMFEGPVTSDFVMPKIESERTLGIKTLVGVPWVRGCFSVMPAANGLLDIALYPDTQPEVISQADVDNATYIEVDGTVPGWGFGVYQSLRLLKEYYGEKI